MLARQRSRHGERYDTLLDRVIPHRMLHRAWIVAGGDAEAAMEFVRANFEAATISESSDHIRKRRYG